MESEIKEVFRTHTFKKALQSKEKQIWDAFSQVTANFLGNNKNINYKKLDFLTPT